MLGHEDLEVDVTQVVKLPVLNRFVLVLAMLVVGGTSTSLADPADPFLQYRTGKPPALVKKLEPENVDGVHLERVVFRSRLVPTPAGLQPSNVFAYVASPSQPGKYPGLLVLHGGRGAAEQKKAIAWAARGYVVIAPDLPGIADPQRIPNSSGPWKGDFTSKYISANPDVTASPIFDGVLAALQALDLLRSQPNVIPDRIGVVGISWGGYVATIVSGIAGKSVRATFSVYGSGYYDRGSEWQERLAKLPKEEAARWLKYLDAGRRAGGIVANYFVVAATNHEYYWPPAVMATLNEIKGPVNQLFAPNAVDSISLPGGSLQMEFAPNWLRMETDYFAFHLQGAGRAFPVVTPVRQAARRDRQSVKVYFRVEGRPVRVAAYYSVSDKPWRERQWIEVDVSLKRGTYEAAIPATAAAKGSHWLAVVSDERPVTVSTQIETVPNPKIR